MTITINSGDDLTLEAYRRVVWDGESIDFSADCLNRIKTLREEFLRTLTGSKGKPVYGVNVGAGDGSFQSLDAETTASYLTGLNSATSFGRPLPEPVVRGIVFARLGSFVDGSSAVTPELTRYVASMLNEKLPSVPSEGTGGSGEILPLGHLFSSVPSRVALGPKESMSLINGSPCAGALVADTAVRARALFPLLESAFALAFDALNVPDAHFDPALAELWGFGSEANALDRIRGLLAGSSQERQSHQARVSIRIFPRVLATAYEAVGYAEATASVAVRRPGDNPAFIPPGKGEAAGRIISNGSFHSHRAVTSIDMVGRAFADLVQLAQHLIHAVYQDKTAMPDQDNLALGTAYMAAADWSEEARMHAAPSMLSFAAVGQNDVTNPLFAAWRSASRIEECLLAQLAILSTMASQSLYSTHRDTTPGLDHFLDIVREVVPPIDQRRDVGTEIGLLMKRLQSKQLEACSATDMSLLGRVS